MSWNSETRHRKEFTEMGHSSQCHIHVWGKAEEGGKVQMWRANTRPTKPVMAPNETLRNTRLVS